MERSRFNDISFHGQLEITKHLPKALAIATFPRTAMTATKTVEDPKSAIISENSTVLFSRVVWNGGGLNSGRPGRTVPVSKNGDPPIFLS